MKLPSIARGALLVAGGMLLGRASGLLREISLAKVFGLTRAADLAMFAMTLPDLLTNLLIGGAVAAVLIPEYHKRIAENDEQGAGHLIGQSLAAVTLGGLLLMAALYVAAPAWVVLLAPGFEGDDRTLALQMARIALIAFPLSAATAVVSSILQIRQRLTAATLGTLVFNLTVVGVIWQLTTARQVVLASWAVVAGAAVRLGLQVLSAARAGGFQNTFGWTRFHQLSSSLGVRYGQALAAVGILTGFPIVARAFASQVPGDAAAVSYALKLAEVPTGLCGAVLAFVVLPRLSRSVQSGNQANAIRLVRMTSFGIVSMLVPAVLGYWLLASPVVALLFGYGKMSAESLSLVTRLSQISFVGVLPAVLTSLWMVTFHSRRDTRTPMLWGLGALAVLIGSTSVLSQRYGADGIVWSLVGANFAYSTVLGVQSLRAMRSLPVIFSEPGSVVQKRAA